MAESRSARGARGAPAPDATVPKIETLLDAWRRWDGDVLAPFGEHVRCSLRDSADARYLLGIVRNLDAEHEADAITRALLDERLAARDGLLEPLVQRRRELARLEFAEHLRRLVDEAMRAVRIIERHFWLGVLADLVREQPEDQRRECFRSAARRIHSSFRVHRRDRDAAERILARLIWPLA